MADLWNNLDQQERSALQSRIRWVPAAERKINFTVRRGTPVIRPSRPLMVRMFASRGEGVHAAAEAIPLIPRESFDYEPPLTERDRIAQEPIDRKTASLKRYFALAYEGEGAATTPGSGRMGRKRGSGSSRRALARPNDAEGDAPPDLVDHRPLQSPVKYQGTRSTCVAHASLAALEAFPHIGGDLSEQYAHYKFNEFTNQSQSDNTNIRTTDAAVFLARADGRVCREAAWAYIPSQAPIAALVKKKQYAPPKQALENQAYGVGTYKIIRDLGLTGDSIRNTRYLETLVAQGYDIVFGAWTSWDEDQNAGIIPPYLDENGEPIKESGHAMLLVGYNRTEQYFIVKNSFDTTWGHRGYGFFNYDFARLYFKYGFVVDSTEPPASAVT